MKISFLKFISFITFIQKILSFENGIWRGTTLKYQRNTNNQFDLNNPIYYYNISKIQVHNLLLTNKNYMNLRLKSFDKLGGIITNIPKTHNWMIDNSKSYNTDANFFHDTTRSIININYTYDKIKKLELNSIEISALRCGNVKNYRMRLRLTNITSLLDLINKWKYCKTTYINPFYPYSQQIKYSNDYDYKFLLTNDDRINKIFTDNLIVSIPSIIEDYKPFTFLFGCLISPTNYKQLNINYNFKGEIMSIEYNEYEPNKLIH